MTNCSNCQYPVEGRTNNKGEVIQERRMAFSVTKLGANDSKPKVTCHICYENLGKPVALAEEQIYWRKRLKEKYANEYNIIEEQQSYTVFQPKREGDK